MTWSDKPVEAGSYKCPGQRKPRFSHPQDPLNPWGNGADLLFMQIGIIQGAELGSRRAGRLQFLPP